MSTILERIGVYAASVTLAAMDPHMAALMRRFWVDSLGCCYGGSHAAPTAIVRDVIEDLGGTARATVLADGERTSAPHAALANGVATRYWDFMDVYFGPAWTAHPSDNAATVLAVAEAEDSSGSAFLEALYVAYEVQLAFSDLPVERNLWHAGWHHTAACAYASAAAAGKLLGLNAAQIADAMALAGARANTFAEIRHGDIPMDKALSAPLVASSGILAALLARRGFSGARTLLEGPYGFKFAVAGGADVEPLVPSLDAPRLGKLSMKPYPVEGMTIAMVQAAIALRERHALQLDSIERIHIFVHDEALRKPSWDTMKLAPANKETADHSFPYCVAIALLAGRVTPGEFTDAWLSDPRVARLIAITELSADPHLTELYEGGARPARVEIDTKHGRIVEEARYPLGDPRNPMSEADIAAKFQDQAEPVIGSRAASVASRSFNVDTEPSMRAYTASLAANNRGKA